MLKKLAVVCNTQLWVFERLQNFWYRSTHFCTSLDLGLFSSKTFDVKFSRVFIGYKDTHYTSIISEFLNILY